MERKHRLMKSALEEVQNKFFKLVLNLEEKLTELERELFEPNEELRRLMVEKAEPEERKRELD